MPQRFCIVHYLSLWCFLIQQQVLTRKNEPRVFPLYLVSNVGFYSLALQIKCYMKQLLHGLEHCHSRGILHRDIKGSNLLVDYNGILKIGDFGLANFFKCSQKQPLTSRVVTLWYRPPELLLGSTDYGASVDLWSSGCILAELFAGKPIMPGRTEVLFLACSFKSTYYLSSPSIAWHIVNLASRNFLQYSSNLITLWAFFVC